MVAVAQSVEQWTVTPKVVGSSPTSHPQKNKKGNRIYEAKAIRFIR